LTTARQIVTFVEILPVETDDNGIMVDMALPSDPGDPSRTLLRRIGALLAIVGALASLLALAALAILMIAETFWPTLPD
jgi:hypothetical protein